MPDFYPIGGGSSSLEITRTTKGDYTWSVKLYFIGNDMRSIKHVITNIVKARAILEHQLGQKIIPTDEMKAYERELSELAEKSALDFAKKNAAKDKNEQGKPVGGSGL